MSRGGLADHVAIEVSIRKHPALNVDSPSKIPTETIFTECSQVPAQHPYGGKWQQLYRECISSALRERVDHFSGTDSNQTGSTPIDYVVHF